MTDMMTDIETLTNAIIVLEEGASDERRAAIWSLEQMLGRMLRISEDFEEEQMLDLELFV